MKYVVIYLIFMLSIVKAEDVVEQVMVFDPMQMMQIESLTQENRALKLENDALKEKIEQIVHNDKENEERKNREAVMFQTMQNLNERVKNLKEKNENLLTQNELLVTQNRALKVENSELKQRVAQLNKSLLITKEKLKNAFSKLTAQERSAAIKKIHKSVTLDKTRGNNSLSSVVEVHDLHSQSSELEEKYYNYRQRYLIKNGMYRVPVYRLNVRLSPTNFSTVTMTLRYGEIVKYDKIYKNTQNGQDFYRLHTKSGWIYVTDLETLDVEKNLEQKYMEQ